MEAEEVASVLGPQDEVTLFETFPDTARSEKNEITRKTTAHPQSPINFPTVGVCLNLKWLFLKK